MSRSRSPAARPAIASAPPARESVALLVLCAGNGSRAGRTGAGAGDGARALIGIGTGLAFISGSALVRESGGSPLAQGVFGGIALAPGGLALALVPRLAGPLGWRAPIYWTALWLAAGALVVVLACGNGGKRRQARAAGRGRIAPDGDLLQLAALYTASYGLGVVVANWVVELLQRHSDLSDGRQPRRARSRCCWSWFHGRWRLAPDDAAAPRAAPSRPASSRVAGHSRARGGRPRVARGYGQRAGRPRRRRPILAGLHRCGCDRREAPAAAVGAVDSAANLAVLAGTPLLGLTFSMAGERLGFAVVAALWLAALAALPSQRALGVLSRTAESP